MPPKSGIKDWIRQQKLAAKAAQASATGEATNIQEAPPAPSARPLTQLVAGDVVQHKSVRHCSRALRGSIVRADSDRVTVEWDTGALEHVSIASEIPREDVIVECNLLSAVKSKYGNDDNAATVGSSGNVMAGDAQVDVALLDSLRRYRNLDFRSCGLSGLGGLDPRAFSNLQVLDLSCNLISSLATVATFLAAAPPSLTSLNVSDNALSLDTDGIPSSRPTCVLQVLVMNNMAHCTWDLVLALVEATGSRSFRELSLADNGLTSVPDDFGVRVEELESLRLDGNLIRSWNNLSSLGRLPGLTRLMLNRNPLEGSWCDIAGKEADGGQEVGEAMFVSLRSLSLNATCVRSWEQVDALALLSALRDVRLQDIVLTKDLGSDEKRMLLIAHLPNVSSGGKGRQTVGSETCGLLNGSMVTANERRDAHRYFVEYWGRVSPDKRPGRYDELLRTDPLARRLVGVESSSDAARDGHGGRQDESGAGAVSDDSVGCGGGHGMLHDGVSASSFAARGLGRCE